MNKAFEVRSSSPLLFRIAKSLERKKIRGSSWLFRSLKRRGWLDHAVDFRISDSLGIVVPIGRNEYDRADLDNYETEFLDALSLAIRTIPGTVTLIDVGADIGVFSLKLLARTPSISRIVAFEPNDEGFRWLKVNLGRLTISADAIPQAAADFHGKGRLVAPARHFTHGIATNHTQYFLEPLADGPIDVTTIDSLTVPISGNLAIKIDVEGGEHAALTGAVQTIRQAPNVIVALEAHPDVAARTGIDPVECLRLLASVRHFRFTVGETGLPLKPDRAVFDQIAPDQIYNIIALSS